MANALNANLSKAGLSKAGRLNAGLSNDSSLPPRWALEHEGKGAAARAVLRIGKRRVAMDDILSVDASAARDRPIGGLFAASVAFLVVASVLAFLVFDAGWRPRYLIATVFLGLLAAAGIIEATKIKPQNFFEIRLHTRSGGIVTFASTDPDEAQAFLALLAEAGVTA